MTGALLSDPYIIEPLSTKLKFNLETILEEPLLSGSRFYTEKDLFDSPSTLHYPSVSSPLVK